MDLALRNTIQYHMKKNYSETKIHLLSLKPSTTIRLLLMVLFVFLFSNVARAQMNTYKGNSGGNWNSAANWSLNLVPTNIHDAVIPTGLTVIINANALCKSLIVNGALVVGSNNTDRNLTVLGNVTIISGASFKSGGNGGNSLAVGGNLVNDGTFDMNINAADTDVNFNGTSDQTISGVGTLMDFNSLTLTNASTLSINRGITVDKNWTNNGKTVSGSGIVTLTGSGSIVGTAVTAFPNLTITGTIAQGINTTVRGDFKLTAGTFQLNNATSNSLTILGNYLQTGGVFNFNAGTSGTSNMYVAGNLTNSSVTSSILTTGNNAPNGTIIFNGTGTQILTIPNSRAAEWVKYVVNTGSSVQLASNLTLSSADVATQPLFTGKLTINGTINLGSYQVTQAGGVTGAAEVTLNSGATIITANTAGIDGSISSTNITRSFSTGANYVFNGTVSQITSAGMPTTVSNLTMSNTAGVTLGQATTITNNFSNTTGSKANLGNFTHNIAGNWTNNGTFTAGTSTINFNSTASGKTISGTLSGSAGQFYNLTFNGNNGGWVINSNLDIANTLTVMNGAVSMNGIMTVAGTTSSSFTVAAPGILSFENNASLVQSGYAGINSGNIAVKRNSTPIINDDFTYWSSPTSGSQKLLDFSPNTQLDKFFIYNNDWANVNASNTSFTPGIGYVIRSPEGISTSVAASVPFQFTGVPNNGAILVAVTAISDASGQAGLRLIGNPYPSALDADAFIDANITTGTGTKTITGTLYFWTHNHTLSGNNYEATDYATYTKLGGTGTAGVLTGTGNRNVPTKFIASGQGFFVEVDATGTVTFNNAMRSAVNNANTNFYKIASKKTDSSQSHRVWLNLTNNSENFSQALVGYSAEASDQYDPGYDGTSFGGETYGLYSLLGTDELTIQARALPFVEADTVALGYKVNVAGNTTISIDHVDGMFLNDQKVYLEDKLLNIIHNIKSSPYDFGSEAGTFNDRFVLRYTDKTLGTGAFDLDNNSIIISKDKNELKIKSVLENIKRITVFDLLGRKVFEKDSINSNEFHTSNIVLNRQTVLVKVTLTNGKVISKKVIY
jgi:hypothetical protein